MGFFVSLAGAVAVTAQTADDGEPPVLQQVEAKFVCMITNKHFEDEQIAVPVDGQTYYGCCEMCVEKLDGAPESRYATDPVSGARVDKATAVLGADADNNVHYFASVETLRAFDETGERSLNQ
jgi:YHS domain-containing protein